ncbi:MAG: hypothetical protein IJU54_01270 [Alphaproteobacteria bacterium]|nr:hypothetical protein [Alphaproteobacteria bacterium]
MITTINQLIVNIHKKLKSNISNEKRQKCAKEDTSVYKKKYDKAYLYLNINNEYYNWYYIDCINNKNMF